MQKLSFFDKIVWFILISLAFLTAFVLWRGDQVGLQIVSLSPSAGQWGVSTHPFIEVTFTEELAPLPENAHPLSLSPAISGTITQDGPQLRFIPATSLQPQTTYRVTLAAGLQSSKGRPLFDPLSWQFETGQLRIIYLAPDEAGLDQLFITDLDGNNPFPLTNAPQGVWDYARSPNGIHLAYTTPRLEGGSDMWLMTLDGTTNQHLLACPEDNCTEPAWHPTGQRLIYTRQQPPTPGQLWWFDISTAETSPVFQDVQQVGFAARWSPTGDWLNYVSPIEGAVHIFNLTDGTSYLIPTQMGQPAIWSPKGDRLLLTDVKERNGNFVVQILRFDLDGDETANLSGEAGMDDNAPLWSPDSQQIAFARKAPQVPMGRQLWLMHPDGSNPRQLTDDTTTHTVPLAWSPTGRFILLQRITLGQDNAQPGLWRYDIQNQTLQPIISPARQGNWLP